MLRLLAGAALFHDRFLEFADTLLEIDADARAYGLLRRVHHLGDVQLRDFFDHRDRAVAAIRHRRIGIDLTDHQKLAHRTERGRAVKLVGAHLDEIVHAELGNHRRLHPGLLVVGYLVEWRDLRI